MKIKYLLIAALCCLSIGGLNMETALAADGNLAIQEKFAALESSSGGRLGVAMLGADGGSIAAYRDSERFPVCSTFKMMLAAAVLKRSLTDPGLMERRISFTKDDLVPWSPITEKHLAEGMPVVDLCAAAIQQSDNAAANLLLKLLGGPEGLTAFARSIGDPAFRLDRWETALNEALPGDERDTTTPAAMANSLRTLAFGEVLPAPQREMLLGWLKGNTTGGESIRAGVPSGWTVGDKTGSGSYGTTNDIAVLWPPEGQPMILAVYFTQKAQDASHRRDVIAAAAKLAVEQWLARNKP